MVLTPPSRAAWATLSCAALVAACGGAAGDGGPRVQDGPQSIRFDPAPALRAGATATVSAQASSGLPVSYGSQTPTVCSVDAASGALTGLAIGTCTLAANQGGNDHFAPAPQAVLTLSVEGRPQAVTLTALPALLVGASAQAEAVASSGLAVAWSSQTPEVCSVSAAGLVHALAAGTCTIAADQAGDATWQAAAQALQSALVSRAGQTLAFSAAPAGLTVGSAITLGAGASSGLAPAYASETGTVCRIDAVTGLLTPLAIGNCIVTASQPGDVAWAPATPVSLTLPVAGKAQSISFDGAPDIAVGGSAALHATASSGLAVSYRSLTGSVCTVDAGTGLVNRRAVGRCTIAADQAGNGVWAPAPQASLSFTAANAAQSINFSAAPALVVGGTATVRAVATSGLPVSYASLTPQTCGVNATTGLATGLATGSCTIAARQDGDATWAAAAQATQTLAVAPDPVQTISFGAAPSLTLGGTATVRATASSGLAVAYASLSAGICSVNAASGLVSAFSMGDCVIAANQAGNASYNPAPQATQTLPVQAPAGVTVPGVPQGVTATLGTGLGNVVVAIGSVASGGSGITGYTVVSRPAGITVHSASAPVTVNCPSSCAGYAFAVYASNALGAGSASAAVEVLTTFDVLTRFHEPDTQPRDSLFTGSFTLNSTTGAISGLAGRLTESMTGNAIGSPPYYDMTQVPLSYQLQSWRDAALGGSFVASFAKNTTSTFSTAAGGDGWSPQAGIAVGGVYAGFPARYATTIQNSSILVFVPDDPFAPLTAAQLARLAYADCAPGGMMGAVCMTATSSSGYGAVGTMSGYPVSQQITRR
ncbi:hypothetical protein LXT12_10775 [Pelomonas sp. P7]|uniref:BIG2 domain-containing protein n=1 Tax=Pelomonas caseinilytica TaxID=2906763 RepID=A0ABS8XFF5_9BURK|nr:hypothetical protein [Pelomonas sp. P7]MCE4537732.1 hypothetical protein [Pelomonas sp. P7]